MLFFKVFNDPATFTSLPFSPSNKKPTIINNEQFAVCADYPE